MANPQGASKEAIQYHYDVGNGFYKSWLDETLTYSAALWPTDPSVRCTLTDAQLAKLDWHLSSSKLGENRRLLDVGCGWGSLMLHARYRTGCREAVGLTLSESQADYIKKNISDSTISARVCSWRDYNPSDVFDAIISIGALEHFSQPAMTRPEKIECYSDFFKFCAGCLAADGTLSVQAITWMNIAPGSEDENLPHDIFPQSNLCHVVELVDASDPYFHMMEFTNRPSDYSKTLRAWLNNLRQNRQTLADEYGMDTVRRYMRGFTGFVLGFDNGVLGLSRMKFIRRASAPVR